MAGFAADRFGLSIVMWMSCGGALLAAFLSLFLRETAPAVLAGAPAQRAYLRPARKPTMKALRWHAARDLRLSELERQAPRPGEVELEVAYCGICGSDLHEYQSGPHSIPQAEAHLLSGCRAPLTLGHEFCGVVAALGPGVEGLRIGDRVAVEPEYRCGECRYCREGRYNLCESMGFIGLMGDGGFAERARVPAYMLHRLPDAVGFRQAAVLEPAAVALHALRRSSLAPGQRCAVFGARPDRPAAGDARPPARNRGHRRDRRQSRSALAGEFGASRALDARDGDTARACARAARSTAPSRPPAARPASTPPWPACARVASWCW